MSVTAASRFKEFRLPYQGDRSHSRRERRIKRQAQNHLLKHISSQADWSFQASLPVAGSHETALQGRYAEWQGRSNALRLVLF